MESIVQPKLIDLVASVLNVDPGSLTQSSGPKTVSQWDSLAHITIASAVEQTYGVELTMPEILGVRTISDLNDALQRRGAVVVMGGSRS